jgi:hypothetical protein
MKDGEESLITQKWKYTFTLFALMFFSGAAK